MAKLTIRLPEAEKQAIRDAAGREKRTVTSFVRHVLDREARAALGIRAVEQVSTDLGAEPAGSKPREEF